ncbi:MAG TPA: ketopantoate reductase family protein [Steroidobacteraceae bacterium]
MENAKVEFAILGAGAMGSIVGAHLARAGHSVLMLARGRRVQQIEQSGLCIKGLADFSQSVAVSGDASRLKQADVLVVAVKTHGTEAALEPLRGARIGAAFSLQNGLMKNEQLSAALGPERVLGALANSSGELLAGGEVLFTRNEQICVGELAGGDSGRVQRIARTIDAAGVRTSAVSNIQSLEWSKFAAWVGLMALSVTTRAETWRYLIDKDAALVLVRLVREVGQLATAANVAVSDQSTLPVASICSGSEGDAVATIQALGQQLKIKAPQHRMSTLQDLEAGRPLEVEETLGFAARKAAQLKLPLPLLDSFYSLIAGMDRMRR